MATIILNWQDNSGNEDGFKIYKSTDGITFNLEATLGVGIITYTSPSIIDGQQYWFRVTAFNTQGESAYVQAGPVYCNWPQPVNNPPSSGSGSGIKNAIIIATYNNMNSYNGGI